MTEKLKILVVDDEESCRIMLRAAGIPGINRRTLQNKPKQYGLAVPPGVRAR